MARHSCAWARARIAASVAILVVAGCVQAKQPTRLGQVRFDIGAKAIKAVVLGSGATDAPLLPDELEGVRSPSGLLLISPAERMLLVLDPAADVLDRIAQLQLPDEMRADRTRPVDRIGLTHLDEGILAGLTALAGAVQNGTIDVATSAEVRAELLRGTRLGAAARARLVVRALGPGAAWRFGAGCTISPVIASRGDAPLGFRVAGAEKTLLFLPRAAPWDRYGGLPALLDAKVDLAFLPGSCFDAADGDRRGDEPSILESALSLEAAPRTRVWFTHFGAWVERSGADLRMAQLRALGFAPAVDGSEYWL